MSDLSIFSLLVVGRDMPHPFARMAGASPRFTDRMTPAARSSRRTRVEPDADPSPLSQKEGRGRLS